jgi:hypothetical protein
MLITSLEFQGSGEDRHQGREPIAFAYFVA